MMNPLALKNSDPEKVTVSKKRQGRSHSVIESPQCNMEVATNHYARPDSAPISEPAASCSLR